MVTFPDIPEAIAQGNTIEEALARAHEALATALDLFRGQSCRASTFKTKTWAKCALGIR